MKIVLTDGSVLYVKSSFHEFGAWHLSEASKKAKGWYPDGEGRFINEANIAYVEDTYDDTEEE